MSYMSYKRKIYRDSALFSGINIVPFTDIILVLLIIFMISAPSLMYSSLGLKLPRAANEDPLIAKSLKLGLDKKGNIFIEGSQIEIEGLKTRLAKAKKKNPSLSVNLDADKNAKHGQVVLVLDLLRELKIEKIYIGTQKK